MHEYQGAAASEEPRANNADNNGGGQRLASFILCYRRQNFCGVGVIDDGERLSSSKLMVLNHYEYEYESASQKSGSSPKIIIPFAVARCFQKNRQGG